MTKDDVLHDFRAEGVPAFAANDLPAELAAIPVEDPGSRRLSA